MTNPTHNSKRGFTIIETLVAVFMLSMVVAAAYSATQSGLINSTRAKQKVTSYYLAHEAIEVIKNIRDYNNQEGVGPATGKKSWLLSGDISLQSCSNGNGCAIDATTDPVTVTNCTSACPGLYINNATDWYTLQSSGGAPSGFIRTVKITFSNDHPESEAYVTVTVKSTKSGLDQVFSLTESIYSVNEPL